MAIFKKLNSKKIDTTVAKERAENFVRYLKEKRRLDVTEAYLFGSYAKGTQRKWSDIDVCIISPYFKNRDAISYLWHNRRDEDVDNQIEPVGFNEEEFSEDWPLVREIKQKGIRIA